MFIKFFLLYLFLAELQVAASHSLRVTCCKKVLKYFLATRLKLPTKQCTTHLSAWHVMDKVIPRLDVTQPAYKLLWMELEKRIEAYERRMNANNSIETFLAAIYNLSGGLISTLPKIKFAKTNGVPEEFEMLQKFSKNGQKYYESYALEYFQKFQYLQQNYAVVRRVFPKTGTQADATAYITTRLGNLQSATELITGDVDYHLTSFYLATSWALSQYLKYASRIFPDLRDNIYTVLDQYYDRLQQFASQDVEVTHIRPLNPPIKKDGEIFTDMFFVSVPSQIKGVFDYHCAPMQTPDYGGQEKAVLVYAPKDILLDPKNLILLEKAIISKIKSV